MWHVWDIEETPVFVGEKMQGRDHLEDLGVDGRKILKFFCKK
jgi:hypothetical protein